MNKRNVVIAIIYDSDESIYVQARGKNYAYWGGGIEEGETSEQALFRELEEELKYQPEKVTFWKSFSFQPADLHVFLIPAPEDFENFQVYEGDRVVKMSLDQAISEQGFLHKEDRQILQELKAVIFLFSIKSKD